MSLRFFGVIALSCMVATALISEAWGQDDQQQVAGVAIDADGVLKMHTFADPGGRLSRAKARAARASLDPELSRRSELRKVSLNRLEKAIQTQLDRGESPTDAMLHLAGLTRLKYVFFYPETDDIVIAGPAEGWAPDLSGRVVGYETGRPVLKLQDLVVALRAFPPSGRKTSVISCSIDPTQEGLKNMQQFLRRVGRSATPDKTEFIVNGLRRSLGMQKITIKGIPADTNFAQVLVEADYRMKLIGIGLERTRVRGLKAYVDLANPAAVAANALQRWYFVPDYECVRVTEDKLGMELVGEGVKLIGADEMVRSDGTRVEAGRSDAAGKRFVKQFTAKYPELSAALPVYAQLRNCIDLAVAASFIQQQNYYSRAGWSMERLGEESSFPVQTIHAPEKVKSAVTAVWKIRGGTGHLMTPIGGGVKIQAAQALDPANLLSDEQGRLAERRQEISLSELDEDHWWWD